VTNPLVAQRLAQQSQSLGRTITDPVQRGAQSQAQLVQVIRREAAVRAFNDVFRVIGAMALAFLAWAFYRVLRQRMLAWLARRRGELPAPV